MGAMKELLLDEMENVVSPTGFTARTIKDPYHGRGVVLSYYTRSGANYGIEFSLGLTHYLARLSLEATPPFNTIALNTGDKAEAYDKSLVLTQMTLKVALAWVGATISMYRSDW